MWPLVVSKAHDIGHEGFQKTLHHLRAMFYCPYTGRLVRDYICSCMKYRCNKTEHLHLPGLLPPLLVPQEVWCDIAMDFVEGFSMVHGKSVILTVVDHFPKFAHFIALDHPNSATSVAHPFFGNNVYLHGFPCSIVSDHNPVYTSTFWS